MEEEVGKENETPNSNDKITNQSPQNPNKKTAKSCKGCVYYSSTFKSNNRNPLCVGISRSLPQGLFPSLSTQPFSLTMKLFTGFCLSNLFISIFWVSCTHLIHLSTSLTQNQILIYAVYLDQNQLLWVLFEWICFIVFATFVCLRILAQMFC